MKMSTGRLIGIISGVLLIVASFLPWAKVEILGLSQTVTGIQGDGIIQAPVGAIAVVLLLLKKVKAWIPLIFGLIAAVVAGIDFMNLSSANADLEGASTFAYGFYLVIVAVVGLLIGCVMAMMKGKGGMKDDMKEGMSGM